LANTLAALGEPDRAVERLRRASELAPKETTPLQQLGDLYMAQDSRDLALTAYLEALDKDGGQNPAKALRPAQILVSRGACFTGAASQSSKDDFGWQAEITNRDRRDAFVDATPLFARLAQERSGFAQEGSFRRQVRRYAVNIGSSALALGSRST
jgi:tetratricopeptide (TPR) repeat protein